MSKTFSQHSFLTLPNSIALSGIVGLFCAAAASLVGTSPLLGVIVACGLLGIATAFIAPQLLLFGLLIVRMTIDATATYLTIPINTAITLTLSQVLGIGVFALALIVLVRERTYIARMPFVGIFALLSLWALSSIIISVSPAPLTTTLYEVLRMITIFTIYVLAFVTVSSHAHFQKLLLILLIGSVIPLGMAFVQLLTGNGYTDIAFDTPRVFGTFAHPNIFSTYLVAMVAVGVLTLRTTSSIVIRNWTRAAIIVYIIVIILTFARVSWIALIIFALIITSVRFTKFLPLLIAVPILLYLSVPALHTRITEALHPGVDSSITWRLGLWNDTVSRTINDGRALYGNGIGTFDIVAESVRGIRFGSTDPHNEYVRSFVEGGWIGLGVFLIFTVWLIGTLLFWAWHAYTAHTRDVFLILFALATALAFASLSDHIFRSTPLQWILFALIGGAFATYKK